MRWFVREVLPGLKEKKTFKNYKEHLAARKTESDPCAINRRAVIEKDGKIFFVLAFRYIENQHGGYIEFRTEDGFVGISNNFAFRD